MAQCGDGAAGVPNAPRDMAAAPSAPTVTSVQPSSIGNNQPTKLILTGTDFRPGATVQVGGVDCSSVAVLSSTSIVCSYPGQPMHCGGQSITVTDTDTQQSGTLPPARGLNLISATWFTAQANYAVGGGEADSAVVADFDRDGFADIAVADSEDNTVSVLLGNGHGGFFPASHFPTGSFPIGLAVGDFNKDQNPDLAVVNSAANSVSVLLGDGMGDFAAPSNIGVGSSPAGVAVADFNGDQSLDLVVTNSNDNNISLLLGDGHGSFSTPANFAVGMGPYAVAVGDFNGDHSADLAVANWHGSNISILISDGTGGFFPGWFFSAGPYGNDILHPRALATGDFDGDQNIDIVVANYFDSSVNILYGDGRGDFSVVGNTGSNLVDDASSIAVGDLDGDGRSELAIAYGYTGSVNVLGASGGREFAYNLLLPFSSTGPRSVAMGDFNGDGKLDLAVGTRTNSRAGSVSILLQTCQ
jgi:hypothetical protein